MAPMVHSISRSKSLYPLVCTSGQHKEMLDQVLDIFNINQDYDLNIMKKNQDLFDITSAVMLGLRDILKTENPSLVLVHGDTTTALGSALASYYMGIPIGHVEAGLRTNNLKFPFPEEANRQLVDRLSDFCFAPTAMNKSNLLAENIPKDKIYITGNTVIDAMLITLSKINTSRKLEDTINKNLKELLGFTLHKKIVLITGHRRENFGKGLLNLCSAIDELAKKYSDYDFIYPVHLNPNVLQPVTKLLNDKRNVHLIDPLDYESFLYLISKSHFIISDSGGIQEEAPGLGKPVLVTRNETEREEAVEAKTVKLVGNNKSKIISEASLLIESKEEYLGMSKAKNPYGDGKSADLITKIIENNL